MTSSHSHSLELWHLLRDVSRQMEQRIRREMATRCNLSWAQFELLAHLNTRSEGLNMTQIARCLMVTPAYVAVLARSLSEERLLARTPASDRRMQVMRLTEAGTHCIRKLCAEHDEILAKLLARHSKAKGEALLRVLAILKRRLRAAGVRAD